MKTPKYVYVVVNMSGYPVEVYANKRWAEFFWGGANTHQIVRYTVSRPYKVKGSKLLGAAPLTN